MLCMLVLVVTTCMALVTKSHDPLSKPAPLLETPLENQHYKLTPLYKSRNLKLLIPKPGVPKRNSKP